MTHVESDRSMALFERMLEEERGDRRAWLERECAGRPDLLDEIWAMYKDAEREDGFLLSPVSREAAGLGGRELGSYRLLRRLGSGGMGAVWLAERVDGEFTKHVALKLIKRGMDTEAVIRRFRVERQVLADLEHPRIARLLDGGTTPDGLPYLVMEYVEGRPLLDHCTAAELSVEQRLRLFQKICSAVQHAHDQHVVHRDLKPANILVEADGEPKLLDFGVAKVVEAEEDRATLELTRTGERFLSPRYASPEQLRGEPAGVASDVYSLGVILFELLTGHHPHGWNTTTWREFEEEVLERDPLRPSRAVLRDEQKGQGAATRSARSRSLRGDLDTIVLTALRKEPERRYTSAGELARDIGLHLSARPVKARPDTLRYRAAKYVRRNRGLVLGAGSFVALLAVGLAVTFWLFLQASRADAESTWLAYTGNLAAAESSLRSLRVGAARRHLEQAPEELRGWEWQHLSSRLDNSTRSLSGRYEAVLDLDAQRGRLAFVEDARVRVVDAESFETVREFSPTAQQVRMLALSGDGRWIAWVNRIGPLWLGDIDDGSAVSIELQGSRPGAACFHPTEGRLFLGLQDGRVEERRPPDWTVVAEARVHEMSIDGLTLAPDGSRLITTSWDETAKVLETDGLELVHDLRGFRMGVVSPDVSPDGRRLVTSSLDGSIRVWDLDSGEPLLVEQPADGFVLAARFDPDGGRILSTTSDGAITLWDATTRERITSLLGHERKLSAMVVDDVRGRVFTLAAGRQDTRRGRVLSVDMGSLREWDLDARAVRSVPASEYSNDVHFDPRSVRLASSGPDGRVRIWSWPELLPLETLEHELRLFRIAFGPTGDLAIIDETSAVRVLDAGSGAPRLALEPVPGSLAFNMSIAFDPRGERFLRQVPNVPYVEILDARTGAPIRRLEQEHGGELTLYCRAVFDPSGTRVAAISGEDGRLVVWDVASGEVVAELETGTVPQGSQALAFHPNGELLVAGRADGKLVFWEPDGDAPARFVTEYTDDIVSLAFHPDGSRLATGGNETDPAIRIWDTRSERVVLALEGHRGAVAWLAFSPDGSTLASASYDATVRLWETERWPR